MAGVRCWWCSRPGETVSVEVSFGVHAHFKDPVLCPICTSVLGLVGGGFAYGDERRRAAQAEARRKLIDTNGLGCGWCRRDDSVELVSWTDGGEFEGTAPLCAVCQELLGFGCGHEQDDPFNDEPCDETTDAVYIRLAHRGEH